MSTFEVPIGDTEHVMIVTAQWTPDPAVLAEKMFAMAANFGDWTTPMSELREVMIRSTRRRFDYENAPDGQPWEELNEDYWYNKVELQGFPDEILVRSEAMFDAVISPEAWHATGRALFFNAQVLPRDGKGRQYGGIHQKGGPAGKGAVIPARPFIGPDDEAVAEMEAIFLRHLGVTVEEPWEDESGDIPGPTTIVGMTTYTTSGLEGTLSSAPSMAGPGFKMVRGAGGRFIGHTFIGE